jgi:hypothetical protein
MLSGLPTTEEEVIRELKAGRQEAMDNLRQSQVIMRQKVEEFERLLLTPLLNRCIELMTKENPNGKMSTVRQDI